MSDNFESKLSEFRSKKVKSRSKSREPLNVLNIWHSIRRRIQSPPQVDINSQTMSDRSDQRLELLANEYNTESDDESHEADLVIDEEEVDEKLFDCNKYDIFVITLKALIYMLCQTIAFLLQFGAVFFSLALLVFICTNLRNRSKRKGELSAYSVFNPNCEPIHGTVSAKDLENQLTFGALHHI